jgi:hypothetical protein
MAQSKVVRIQQSSALNKALYTRRKAMGLCAHCGAREPYPGMVSCLECRKEFRIYQQRYAFKLRAMKAQGLEIVRCPCRKRALVLCIQCQAPLCDTCYDLGEGCCSACREGDSPEDFPVLR